VCLCLCLCVHVCIYVCLYVCARVNLSPKCPQVRDDTAVATADILREMDGPNGSLAIGMVRMGYGLCVRLQGGCKMHRRLSISIRGRSRLNTRYSTPRCRPNITSGCENNYW
jgi:hypothetical protein